MFWSVKLKELGFSTRQVHADRLLNKPADGAVHTATTNSVLFGFDRAQEIIDVFQGKQVGHVYSRSSSPSVVALQNMLNQLENGVGAVCFATGMAAISATLLSLLKAGDHIIVSQYLFGNTRSFMAALNDFGIDVTFVDVTRHDAVLAALQDNTKMVYAETIANPVTQVADLLSIGKICQERNALFVVDNTMTPSPLCSVKELGASLIVCSLTKYIAGHGNVLGGVVVDCGNFDWRSYSNIKPEYRVADITQWGITQIKKRGLRDIGATLAPGTAHAIATGMETLAMRMQKNNSNAEQLACYLDNHAKVQRVYYPGLASHPQHQLARDLFGQKYGAILSIELAPGIDMLRFLDELNLVICATHLGDNRTLALPVAPTIFYENGIKERIKMGITENMVRISVGIEDIQDIIEDFNQAFSKF